jgi:hypothetical protein
MISSQHDQYLQNKRQKENNVEKLLKDIPGDKIDLFYVWLNENYAWVEFNIYKRDSNVFFGITSVHSQSITLGVLKDIERKLKRINLK